MVITIAGRKHWLCAPSIRTVMCLTRSSRLAATAKAAKRLLTRLLKKQGIAPKRIITDKLRSYGAARRQVMPNVEHRSHKGLNNRAENSHVPLRKRERTMQGSDRREICNASSQSSPPSEISSSHPVPNDLHSKFTCIAFKRSWNGKLCLELWSEIHPRWPTHSPRPNVTLPRHQMRSCGRLRNPDQLRRPPQPKRKHLACTNIQHGSPDWGRPVVGLRRGH
ncbi:DDE-type integrase/transposase/recombinase [Mesorhizobium sp. M0983]|uniref:DDE-type integrase/transposase/recombinase n=1 Tax=Mesorhizobium sp. M0983 TaxID=2957040 RepID=UPI003338C639